MAWYDNLLGTGANIFGAGTSLDMDRYKKAGLLAKDGSDFKKAKTQSLARGLLGTAVGYLAQPQNQDYGSIVPYLAKGYQQGMTQAQTPFDNLEKQATNNATLDALISKNAKQEAHDKAVAEFIKNNPEYAIMKDMPMENQAKIMQDALKPMSGSDINKEKAVMAMRDELMIKNPEMSKEQAERKARVTIAMKPPMEMNMGNKFDYTVQTKMFEYVDGINKMTNSGIDPTREMQLAQTLMNQAGSEQGFGAGLINTFSAIADRLGVNIASNDKADILRAIKSVQVKLALGQRAPGSGPMTDKDFENYLSTTINMENPQATNEIIAYIAVRKQQEREKFADALGDYVKQNGYDQDIYKFERAWNKKNEGPYSREMEAEIARIVQRHRIAKSNTGMTETEIDTAVASEDEVMNIIESDDKEIPNEFR